MARLAAQAQALYYPTELRVIAGIARLLELEYPAKVAGPIRVIDPAAGTGRAAAALVKLLVQQQSPQKPAVVELYGIELEVDRARECQKYMTAVLNTDAKTAKVTDRSFDLLFGNPPYDNDTLGQDRRLEHAFLIRSTKMVRAGGYIVWIIPRHVLKVSADWLAAFYKDHIVRRFPKPECERFDQIVIVAQRKAAKLPNPKRAQELSAMATGEAEIKLLDCPAPFEFEHLLKELAEAGIYGPEIKAETKRLAAAKELPHQPGTPPKAKAVITLGPKAGDKMNFAYGQFHPAEALIEAEKVGIWSNRAKRDLLFVPPSQAMVIKAPLMPMRIGMSSQLIQIGLGNNLLLQNEKRKIAIKGKTVKKWKNVAVELDEEGVQKKRIDREVISSEIKLLDLTSGEVETLEAEGLGKLVEEFSTSLQAQMLQNYPPLYVPLSPAKRQAETLKALEGVNQDPNLAGPHNKNKRRKARQETRLIQELEAGLSAISPSRKPLGGQKLAIPAAALSLKKYGYATMECEMGTGKSCMGIAAAYLAGARRPIVTCPSTLLEKWVREVRSTLPGAEAMVVSSITDLEKARQAILAHEKKVRMLYNPDLAKGEHYPPFFTIMSKEQMKLESSWQAAAVYHPPRGETIGRTATSKTGHSKLTKTFWAKDLEGGPYYPKDKEGRLLREPESGKLFMWPHCPRCDNPIVDKNGLPAKLEKIEKRIICTNCGEPLWQRKSKLANSGLRFSWETAQPISILELTQAEETARQLQKELIEDFQRYTLAGESKPASSSFRPTSPAEEAGYWLLTFGEKAYEELYHMFTTSGKGEADRKYASKTPQEWGEVARLLASARFSRFKGNEGENDDGWLSPLQYRDTQPTGYRKVKLSQYVLKRMKGFFDLCIIDEVHQMKAKGSAQGISAGRLAMACRQTLTLTGTFADGYSSMVMQLLWRFTDPKIRKLWDRNETGRWASKYGIIKATRLGRGGAPDQNDEAVVLADGANSDREVGGRVRFEEAPGISPELALLTIPHTVYLSLADVTKDLPPYHEFPTASISLRKESDGVYGPEYGELAGKPLPSQSEAYHTLAHKLTTELRQQLARGSTRLLGAMVHSLLAWVDNPTQAEVVRDPKTKFVIATAPALPKEVLYPKEQKLVELYKRTKAAGQKLLIYIAYTDARDMAPRLKWVLQEVDPNVKVAVMGSGDAKKREGWIEKQLEAGCDVLITHPKKVEVGLDLLKFPVIIFYNIYYVTQTIEQAKKRAWRIGQTQPCETHFWAYGGTAQEKGLRHVARKIYAAAKLKGQIVDEGIAELLGDDEEESMLKAIAQAITCDEPDGARTFSLESLMSEALDQERADNAFMLSDEDTDELEVEETVTTFFNQTYDEHSYKQAQIPNLRLLPPANKVEKINTGLSSNKVGQNELALVTSLIPVKHLQAQDSPSTARLPESEHSQLLLKAEKDKPQLEQATARQLSLEEFRVKLLAGKINAKKRSKKNETTSFIQDTLFDLG